MLFFLSCCLRVQQASTCIDGVFYDKLSLEVMMEWRILYLSGLERGSSFGVSSTKPNEIGLFYFPLISLCLFPLNNVLSKYGGGMV